MVDLIKLQKAIELHLEHIEKILGTNYKLTLIAKYHGEKPLLDADIIFTMDTRDNIISVIDRFLPESSDTNEAVRELK